MRNVDLTQRLEDLARQLGADLFGVAPAARYIEAGAPLHMRPDALLPGATYVVVSAVHHPDAVIEMGGEPDPQTQGPYAIQGRMNEKLEHIMFQLADLLEREGHRVLGLPATNIWRFRGRPEEDNPFLPDLSNIHAGWLAGLGEIGWSGLLLTPEFGPRQRLCCLVTDAPLSPSPMYRGEPLCDRCDMCVKVCPTDAFQQEVTGEVVLFVKGSTARYCKKSKWRCSWAEHFGLDLDLPKPAVITEQVILEQLAQHGVRGGEMGSCLRFCMCAPKRYWDRKYTSAPRRRRSQPASVEEAAREAYKVAAKANVGTYVILPKSAVQDILDLAQYLPDAEAVIAFTVPYAPDGGPIVQRSAATWADFVELDLARTLEALGYSALPRSGLNRAQVVALAGLQAESAAVGFVVTSAPFSASTYEMPNPLPPPTNAELSSVLSSTLKAAGAHLVGVADAAGLQALVPTLRETLDEEALRLHVRDAGPTHGATRPVIESNSLPVIKGPEDHLPGARSVLVIGLHYPFANLTCAGDPPASSVGPYAYATYQTVRELEFLASGAARMLHDWGYRATVVADLCGTASQVVTPRGLQPDALASRFAAQAAGLATLGRHGAPLTPEFGVTQRFICVVTDAPLSPLPARDLTDVCQNCDRPCVRACPVGALAESEDIIIADVARLANLDCLRCDWAKKYGLVGAEGPALMGQTTDIPPPEGPISAQQIAAAIRQKDPVQRHWTCVVERCLQACQRHLMGMR
ncbi:MAG: hypothetical protein ACUVX8_11745 [Candidatus Zipacnadales bacterium]